MTTADTQTWKRENQWILKMGDMFLVDYRGVWSPRVGGARGFHYKREAVAQAYSLTLASGRLVTTNRRGSFR